MSDGDWLYSSCNLLIGCQECACAVFALIGCCLRRRTGCAWSSRDQGMIHAWSMPGFAWESLRRCLRYRMMLFWPMEAKYSCGFAPLLKLFARDNSQPVTLSPPKLLPVPAISTFIPTILKERWHWEWQTFYWTTPLNGEGINTHAKIQNIIALKHCIKIHDIQYSSKWGGVSTLVLHQFTWVYKNTQSSCAERNF